MHKENVILFGASTLGIEAYEKLKNKFNIKCFCDNDPKKNGKIINNIEVISPSKLKKLKDYKIIITSMYYKEIAKQLNQMGVLNYEIFKMNYFNDEIKFTNIFSKRFYYRKLNSNPQDNVSDDFKEISIKKILFVETVCFNETYKIAKLLKQENIGVELLLIDDKVNISNKIFLEKRNIFNNVIIIKDKEKILNFINNSDYDIVHNSNEKENIKEIIRMINKPIVNYFDNEKCFQNKMFYDSTIFDYLDYKICKEKDEIFIPKIIDEFETQVFDTNESILLTLNNDLFDEEIPTTYLKKESNKDGKIHCVYIDEFNWNKTGIASSIEDRLLKIANHKIHIHIYTKTYNKYYDKLRLKSHYIHIEKFDDERNLLKQLTRYDLGLAWYNINYYNKFFLSSSIPETIWRYMAAGIPILTEDLYILKEFLVETGIGENIDFNIDIVKQIKNVKNFTYDCNLVKRYTINNQKKNIVDYYKKVKLDYSNYYNNVNSESKNKFNKSKEITIIIPTRNRPSYLKRCISYYSLMDSPEFKINIHVLDSSDYENKKIIRDMLEKLEQFKNVKYIEFDEEIMFFDKLLYGVKKVETDICAICADDDFLVKNGMLKSIDILKKNKEYITVKSENFRFYDNDIGNIVREKYCSNSCRNLDSNDSLERLINFVEKNNFYTLIYSCFRTKFLEKAIESSIKNNYFSNLNIRFANSIFYFMIVITGKVYKADFNLSIREDSKSSATYKSPKFHDTIFDGTFDYNYESMQKIITSNLGIENKTKFDMFKFFCSYFINTLGIEEQYLKMKLKNINKELLREGFRKAGWINQ